MELMFHSFDHLKAQDTKSLAQIRLGFKFREKNIKELTQVFHFSHEEGETLCCKKLDVVFLFTNEQWTVQTKKNKTIILMDMLFMYM